MKDREMFLAAHYQSAFHQGIRFRLLDEIEKHPNGEKVIIKGKDYAPVIAVLLQGILNKTLNRYNLNDDYIKEQYKIKDISLSFLLCELAFYQAGCKFTDIESNPSINFLADIKENMDGGFFVGYQPNKNALTSLISSLDGEALKIASESRDIDRRPDALRNFCEELDKETDEDKIIDSISPYNDGSYVELPLYIQALADILEKNESWEDYYKLLDTIKYFPLQGGLIKWLGNICDVLSLIKVVDVQNGRKTLHYLLRDRFFDLFCRESNTLSNSLGNRGLSTTTKDYVKTLLEKFEAEGHTILKTAVDIWLKEFGREELTSWLSKKKTEAERKHIKYGKQELEVVEMISKCYTLTFNDIAGFNLENKDFQTLVTLASCTEDKDVCKRLIQALKKNIFSDRSYPPTKLNEIWFEQARVIYHCMKNSGVDGLMLLKDVRKPYEGFRVKLKTAIPNDRQEAYWLAMLLLSLEENADEKMFGEYVDVLFKDTRYSINSLTDEVFTPYYIAELLVSQVMAAQKDGFEKKLIKEIPYLVFVIRVLTANDGVMSEDVSNMLADRIKKEWLTERKLLKQNRMVDMAFYDEYVKKYM